MSLLHSVQRRAEAPGIAKRLARRAAEAYERAGLWRSAAECWAEAGDPGRAAALFQERLDDPARAAPLLLARGRYAEALETYRSALAKAPPGDRAAEAQARLGIAAALAGLGREPEEAREQLRSARSLVEAEEGRDPHTAGRCWEALAGYGVLAGRDDLVHLGYERALERYGARYPEERARCARAYAAHAAENHLLAAEIAARLDEWAAAA